MLSVEVNSMVGIFAETVVQNTQPYEIVVETLGPKLSALEVSHTDQVKNLNDITNQVSQFMERYNGTVSSFQLELSFGNKLMFPS